MFVTGSFNGWDKQSHPIYRRGNSGIWEGFIPGIDNGTLYEYFIQSGLASYRVDKADPFSIFNEFPQKTASIVWDLEYSWGDRAWMAERRERGGLDKPSSIYEMHLGAWRRLPEEGNRSRSYGELAPLFVDHLRQTGFTHVEFLPLMDHSNRQ